MSAPIPSPTTRLRDLLPRENRRARRILELPEQAQAEASIICGRIALMLGRTDDAVADALATVDGEDRIVKAYVDRLRTLDVEPERLAARLKDARRLGRAMREVIVVVVDDAGGAM